MVEPRSADAAPASRLGAPVVLALGAVWVIWGSTYLAIKIGLETIEPFALQGSRFTVAAAVLYTVLRRRGAPAPTLRQWWGAVRVGLLLLIGGLGLVTLAEERGVGTGLVATLIAVQPMLLSLWGGLWGAWPQRREWIGMGVGLVGVLVLMLDSGLDGTLSGVALVLIASVSWSFGSALSSRVVMPDGAMASACEMTAAAGGYWVLSLVTGESLHAPSLRSAAAVGYLIVFGSIVAFSAFLYLLQRVRPALAVSYAYVNPVIAVALGALFNDEVLSVNLLVALPVILIGVGLVTMAAKRPGRQRTATRSTTNTSVSPPLITPPAPRVP